MRPEHLEYEYNAAQTALWNLCIELQPHYILDIGTLGGTSALLAAHYIEMWQNGHGHVITLDVRPPHKPIDHPLITFVQVWPYATHGLDQYGGWQMMKLLDGWQERIPTAVEENTALARDALEEVGGTGFDLAYVDGDHSEIGLWFDLQMVKSLVRPPHYALLDDVQLPWVPASRLYQGCLRYLYGHYDFDGDGWESFMETRPDVKGMPRMALVWEK